MVGVGVSPREVGGRVLLRGLTATPIRCRRCAASGPRLETLQRQLILPNAVRILRSFLDQDRRRGLGLFQLPRSPLSHFLPVNSHHQISQRIKRVVPGIDRVLSSPDVYTSAESSTEWRPFLFDEIGRDPR